MRVTLSDAEAQDLLVAIRLSVVVHTELMSMCVDKDTRMVYMEALMRLGAAAKKLGG